VTSTWFHVAVSDYRLRALRDRHYSGGVGGKTVGPPGRRIGLVTFEGTAGWLSHWPDPKLARHGYGDAYLCTLFRNEGAGLSSSLIEQAIEITEAWWGPPPWGGWLTFVDERKVASPNPGYCFKCAGFRPVGRTLDADLLVLRRSTTTDRNRQTDR
jgi:hypothetical protein